MRNDELLRYFYQLRSEILKEGRLQTTFEMHTRFTGDDIGLLLRNPPPGAKRFVMGDSIGGNCWEIELPDGSVEKYYVALPERLAQNTTTWYNFPDPPLTHAGEQLQDTSVENLARLYIEYMRDLLGEARLQFAISS